MLHTGFAPVFPPRKGGVIGYYTNGAWRDKRDLHSPYMLDKHACSLLTLLSQRGQQDSNLCAVAHTRFQDEPVYRSGMSAKHSSNELHVYLSVRSRMLCLIKLEELTGLQGIEPWSTR